MKPHTLACCAAVFFPACGGTESSALDDATIDASDTSVDTADAAPSCGDAACERGEVSFDGGCDCGPGSVCVHKPAGPENSTYCVKIPDSCCGGVPTCECMGECACAPHYYRGCVSASLDGIECEGPISIRAAKQAIRYITEEERARLANEALTIPLATYRYRSEAADERSHLGFIIDDQPLSSFAVAADGAHVDLYGYASLLLATVQAQQATIDELRARVARLEGRAEKNAKKKQPRRVGARRRSR